MNNLFAAIKPVSTAFAFVAVSAMVFNGSNAKAAIMGPYTPDATTLHLWHLDETAVPVFDAALGGTNLSILTNGATLGNTSYTGFGNALSTIGAASPSMAYLSGLPLLNGVGDEIALTYANVTSGAFTYEALVRIDFDPATFTSPQPLYIVTAENETGNRPWQWAILPNGSAGTTFRLRFLAGGNNQNITYALPTEGPDALAQGNWYHVAVTFSGGTGGTVKQYWTRMDSTRISANLIGTSTMNNLSPVASGNVDFAIGNVGRTTPNGGFPGLIDEVRLSSIERSATAMMFSSAEPLIVSDPQDQTVAVGQSATFNVAASGLPELSYQWLFEGNPIPDANEDSYSIASAQMIHAGDYSVIVTNNHGAITSAVATLTVRIPTTLSWIGSESSDWNLTALNWDSNGDAAADVAYGGGDHTIFGDNGVNNPVVNLAEFLNPLSVTVNASHDYLFTTFGSGALVGASTLTKQGAGRLVINTDNTYTGSTVISEGMVQIGNADGRGSLGTGPITNNGTLLIDRTGTLVMANQIAGNGSLVKNNTSSLQLLGTNNTQSGDIVLNRGSIAVGPGALGNVTSIAMNASGGTGGTVFTLANGATVGANVNFVGIGGGGDSGNRINITTSGGTNIWNGSISLEGDSPAVVNAGGGSSLELNGPITGPAFNNVLSLRGAGTNSFLRGTVTLPMAGLQKDDGITWIVNSANNSYLFLRILAGPIKLGNDNAIATNSYVRTDGGVLDLAGFNQTVAGLVNTRATPQTVIANSSTIADSRLTVATLPSDPPWISGAIIADSTSGGTRKTSLSLKGGATLTLTNANTYSGDTTVLEGVLALSGIGSIANSTPINLSAGTTLDASARNDGTLTISPSQTLQGNGAFNVLGNLVNNGTIALKLNKSGATLNNDSINGASSITYGGTLRLDITASPALTTSDSFKIFNASSYAGAFGSFEPATPSSGLAWDTSTLTTDGTLRIATSTVNTNPTNITAAVVNGGSAFQLSWPESHIGWTLQVQTNAINVGLSTNWVNVIGSSQTNSVLSPIDPANGSVFYRLVYP